MRPILEHGLFGWMLFGLWLGAGDRSLTMMHAVRPPHRLMLAISFAKLGLTLYWVLALGMLLGRIAGHLWP